MSSEHEFRGVVRSPAYQQVADQLRDAIVDGRYAPGDELPTERELCARFGVSRATVREALRSLQAQGIVIGRAAPFRPVVGTASHPLSDAFALTMRLGQASVLDVIQLRSMLEREAIEHAVLDRDVRRWNAVAGALVHLRASTGDPDRFHDAYVAFHVELVRVAENSALDQVMAAVLEVLHDHLRGTLRQLFERGTEQTITRVVDDHAELLVALQEFDAPRARAALGGHHDFLYTQLLETAPPRFPVDDPVEP